MTTSEPISTGLEPPKPRKHPQARCEDCGLYEGRYAPGTGPDTARFVVLGEAPGYKEAREGKPFIGPSGRLLDTVLANYDIDRNDVYVDNVCACRPSDNRTPTPSEVACCWPRAKAEIGARNPETIICLGNTAAQAVLETRAGITQVRVGPPKATEQFPGARIVPTFHPAACLRAADFFPHLVTDIGKAVSTVEVGWEPPRVTVVDNPKDGIAVAIELAEKYDEMSIDIEVGIDKDIHFGHPEQYQMLCIGIGYKKGFSVVFGENCCADDGFKHMFGKLLAIKKWVMQNGKFDVAGLYGWCGAIANLWFDTMLASYTLDERPGTHGLDYLSTEVLGAPDYKSVIHRYINPKKDSYALVPRDVLYEYNGWDAACTFLLKEHYLGIFDEEQRRLHDRLVEASTPLMWTELEGIMIDDAYSVKLVNEYLDRLTPLEEQLRPWVGNPRSPKQVKEALHNMGFRVSSTDEEHLKNIAEKVDPLSDTATFVRLMLEHRREAKLYGTYVKGIRKRMHEGRIHPSFLLHGTTVGRLACRNPNLFNIPRESAIRQQFIPAPGNVFIQADYKTIELRVMAVEAGDEFLADIFRQGRDIHDEFSLVFYGEGFTKDQRVRTKAFVFGVPYGREAHSIALEHKISVAEAKKNMDYLFQMMPAVARWREENKRKILEEGELTTRFGRHRRFWLITKDNVKDVVKEGWAFIPQGTASDVCLQAFVRLRRDHGLHTRVSVYDSILVECPASDAQRVADLMVRVMEETAAEMMGDTVPFPVEIKIGESWGDV